MYSYVLSKNGLNYLQATACFCYLDFMQSPTFFGSGAVIFFEDTAVDVIQLQNTLQFIGSFTNMKDSLGSTKMAKPGTKLNLLSVPISTQEHNNPDTSRCKLVYDTSFSICYKPSIQKLF